ncbi:type VI secretion system Vgr family protein [Photorhabdus luminescens]|uniref:type VI secretion system Vgr family protein n=1 Tax=Photorhabdus luminescens TaxID=29488 RepID=UPI00223F4317|nr:type VI secretion system Vgr family protein [Photorhabdus luminescens]MCW7764681.1 type VI secretion system tip protein VgrG [Photorhabdus luminescens subsp. venezuelensis]
MDRKMLRARQLQASKPVLPGHARYRLEIRRCKAELEVFSFTGEERLCAPYCYTIDFTSPTRDIDPAAMLNKPAAFILQAPENPEQVRKVHGVITRFNRLAASADETRYQVCLEPYLALLRHTRRSGIYQNQSVPEIVEKILRERHEFRGQDFLFTLVREYPKRELVVQWQESDLDFIQRILAEVGIWYRFEMDGRLGIEVVRFGDNQRNYQYDVRLPLRDPAGMNHNDHDSVWDLHVEHQVVTQSVKVRDYNYREAGNDLQYQVGRDRDTTVVGEVYRYGDNFLEKGEQIQPAPETAGFYARLHHERDLYRQHLISGKSSSPMLVPGLVLELEGERPAAVGKAGVLIVSMRSSARRDSNYLVSFSGIPYSEVLSYRPVLRERPVIAGTVPARVTSDWPNDTYGHIDITGRYRVKFDFDLDEWPLGGESLWVRLARPYAGKTHGFHWPLIQGTEVAIAFEQGNPDRPYIAHALHDSRHEDHVTLYNYRRNVLRTPANNKLRMDDDRGKEHIKLSTEYGGKSQLNLGHLVDGQRPHPNKRGEGFELRTDDWGAIRAGKGLFISADQQVKASGQQLDMQRALAELEAAFQTAAGLRHAAEAAKAELADIETQAAFMNDTLKALQQRALLLSAPSGIAQVTPGNLQISAGENLITTVGCDADMSIMKRFRLAVGNGLSLFTRTLGLKLLAASGRVEIQAQTDAVDVLAQQALTLASQQDRVTVSAKTELRLECGGAYISLKDGHISFAGPKNARFQCDILQKNGPVSQSSNLTLPERCVSASARMAGEQNGMIK